MHSHESQGKLSVISRHIINVWRSLIIDVESIPVEDTLVSVPVDIINNKSSPVQVMAWCHQAPSHCLPVSQCWPKSMASLGHNELIHENGETALDPCFWHYILNWSAFSQGPPVKRHVMVKLDEPWLFLYHARTFQLRGLALVCLAETIPSVHMADLFNSLAPERF